MSTRNTVLPARDLTVAALLASLLAASAWISIPIPFSAVPLTLQVFIVLLVGLVLTPAQAASSVGVYLLLGSVGVPVFSGGQGGPGVLFGPTGGYLLGFLIAAVLVSVVRNMPVFRSSAAVGDGIALAVGVVAIYVSGWMVLSASTGMGLAASFVSGVAPFIIADSLKAIAAMGVASVLRRAGLVRPAPAPAEPVLS